MTAASFFFLVFYKGYSWPGFTIKLSKNGHAQSNKTPTVPQCHIVGLRGYKFQYHSRIVSPTAAEQNGQRNFGHVVAIFRRPLKLLAGLPLMKRILSGEWLCTALVDFVFEYALHFSVNYFNTSSCGDFTRTLINSSLQVTYFRSHAIVAIFSSAIMLTIHIILDTSKIW